MDAGPSVSSSPSRMSSSSNSIISLKSSVLEIASYTLLITLTILLIQRFYKPLDGSILVNDKPIDVYALGKLRQKIAVVPQDLFLYAMSIKDNICIGKLDSPTLKYFYFTSIFICLFQYS